MAIEFGAGYRGYYMGSIFVENTYMGREAEREKTKIFAASAAVDGIGAAGGLTRRRERRRRGAAVLVVVMVRRKSKIKCALLLIVLF